MSPSKRPDRYSRWRAATLALVYVLMAAHVVHWKLAGRTLAPLELNEVMYTLELGILTAGFLFMAVAVLATLIFGRFFCSWGCHILALEDLCAWLLARLKIRPRPVRSRVLLWVPVVAMLYMFVWPQVTRLADGKPMPALHVRADAQGWASFVTTDYWRNLPGAGITMLTFAVCGFVIVYFLGSRAFCTYACPYGAVFSLADRLAPGRIVARKDCTRCGICTSVCSSRVRVHEELNQFGRVVNPACLKDLDCVAVCPNGAVGYGFALPSLFRRGAARLHAKPFDFTVGEDILMGAMFLATLFIFRGLYDRVPFLLTLGCGGIVGYVAVLALRLSHLRHVKLNNFQLKIGDRLTFAGRAFVACAVLLGAFIIHSAFIRYHAFRADRLFHVAQHERPAGEMAAQALAHFEFCNRWGLYRSEEALQRTAQLQASVATTCTDRGDFPAAIKHLREACDAVPGVASLHYDLGVLLAQTGRPIEALGEYRLAAALDPNDADIQNNLGYLLAERGELDAAAACFHQAIAIDSRLAHPHFNLGRILMARGLKVEADRQFRIAAGLDPNYARILYPSAGASPPSGRESNNPITKGNP